MVKISSKKVYLIGSIALFFSIIQQIFFVFYEFIVYFGFIADIIITSCTIFIRFKMLDKQKAINLIINSDILNENYEKKLKPMRFFNGMVIAIIIGTLASITIHYFNIIGIGLYLIMQIIHIWAFSGIIHLNPKFIFGKKAVSVRNIAIISTIGFLIITLILYILMIVPGWGENALLILPYVIALVSMTIITYWGLGYSKRPLRFRIMLCLGASFFFFSDLMIGYSLFTNPFYYAPLFIYPTWILAIFFMQLSILALRSHSDSV